MIQGSGAVMGQTLENSLNFTFSKPNTMCIVVFHSSAVAIGFSDGCYYVFDLHSRGQDGLSNSEFPSKFIAHRGLASCTTFLVLTCLKQVSSFDEKDLHTVFFLWS